jgi:hypothetical protein
VGVCARGCGQWVFVPRFCLWCFPFFACAHAVTPCSPPHRTVSTRLTSSHLLCCVSSPSPPPNPQFATGFSLNSFGFVYVPTACANGTLCALHINFHGCQQTTADILNDYPSHVGLNEWAESNNIIILYPQISKSEVCVRVGDWA